MENYDQSLNKIEKAYAMVAKRYDDALTARKWWSKLYIDLFWRVDDIAISQRILSHLPLSGTADATLKVLDAPCGTMVFTLPYYKQMKHAEIVGLDYSTAMLEKAKQSVQEEVAVPVTFCQGDAANMPLESDSFDVIVSLNGLHAIPNKLGTLDELSRVCRPGGQLIGCSYIKGGKRISDLLVKTVLNHTGHFTPPHFTAEGLEAALKERFSQVKVEQDRSFLLFYCTK